MIYKIPSLEIRLIIYHCLIPYIDTYTQACSPVRAVSFPVPRQYSIELTHTDRILLVYIQPTDRQNFALVLSPSFPVRASKPLCEPLLTDLKLLGRFFCLQLTPHFLSSTIMTPFLTTPLYFFVICYLLVQAGYFTYKYITTRTARRRIVKEHGCEPPNSLDDYSWLPYVFRLKMVKMIRSAVKENRVGKASQERFQKYGNTYSGKVCLHGNHS